MKLMLPIRPMVVGSPRKWNNLDADELIKNTPSPAAPRDLCGRWELLTCSRLPGSSSFLTRGRRGWLSLARITLRLHRRRWRSVMAVSWSGLRERYAAAAAVAVGRD
jgi:hypothetical protein